MGGMGGDRAGGRDGLGWILPSKGVRVALPYCVLPWKDSSC